MGRKFLALVLVGLCWVEAVGADNKAPELIVTAGKCVAHGGRVTVEIAPAKDGRLAVEIGFKLVAGPAQQGATFRPVKGLWEGEKWFVYPEAADRVWVFNGKDELLLYEYRFTQDQPNSIRGEGKAVSSDALPAVVKDAPKAVQDRLPPAFLNGLPRKK